MSEKKEEERIEKRKEEKKIKKDFWLRRGGGAVEGSPTTAPECAGHLAEFPTGIGFRRVLEESEEKCRERSEREK